MECCYSTVKNEVLVLQKADVCNGTLVFQRAMFQRSEALGNGVLALRGK